VYDTSFIIFHVNNVQDLFRQHATEPIKTKGGVKRYQAQAYNGKWEQNWYLSASAIAQDMTR
jgi:hypothetical protein